MKFLTENGMFAAVAAPGMVINYGDGYCHKLYRKTDDFSDCIEVDESEVPPAEDEATEADYQSALREMGVEV